MLNVTRGALALALLVGLIATAGCGDDGETDGDGTGQGAPAASKFPSAKGLTIEELYASASSANQVEIAPAGAVFRKGDNRFPFGVFRPDRSQITDAEVAIYAAPADGGRVLGPFPAKIESLQTDPEFVAQTTATDPDAGKVVYVSDVEFTEEGPWNIVGLVRDGNGYTVGGTGVKVAENEEIPEPGEKAPSVHTPTADEVADISEIDTRVPASSLHDDDLADALGSEPVVLVFATPQLCVSRLCGPVVDIAEQVKSERDDEAAFIHMEIYNDNAMDQGLRPQVEAYNLQSEPWVFVMDADGRVSSVFEGAVGVDELNTALDEVATEG